MADSTPVTYEKGKLYDRMYILDSATLANNQKVSLNQTIVKMRSMLLERPKN